MEASYIDDESWRRINRTVEQVEIRERGKPQRNPERARLRIHLAKTTVDHLAGETQTVKLWLGAKGSETESDVPIKAFNRLTDLEANEFCHVAWVGDGFEIIGRRPTGVTGTACGVCSDPAGTNDVDLGDGLIASEFYGFDPFCSGLLDVVYTWDSEQGLYVASAAGGMTINCVGETSVTWTSTLSVAGSLPGQVVASWSDGTSTWTFENPIFWDPEQNCPLVLVSGPQNCPCAPWRQFPCLRPLTDPGF